MAILKYLQSEWTAFTLGNLAYLIVFVLLFQAPPAVEEPIQILPEGSSWEFHNPEVDRLIDELKTRKTALDQKDIELRELESRLRAEREEMKAVTKNVQQLQEKFDQSVLQLQTAELANLKKIGKTYSLMEPEAAAAAFKSMDNNTAAKILRSMKESEVAPILQVLARGSAADAKRVAEIAERMRVAMEGSVTNKNP